MPHAEVELRDSQINAWPNGALGRTLAARERDELATARKVRRQLPRIGLGAAESD